MSDKFLTRYAQYLKTYESHVLHASTVRYAINNDARHVLVIISYDKTRHRRGSENGSTDETAKLHFESLPCKSRDTEMETLCFRRDPTMWVAVVFLSTGMLDS